MGGRGGIGGLNVVGRQEGGRPGSAVRKGGQEGVGEQDGTDGGRRDGMDGGRRDGMDGRTSRLGWWGNPGRGGSQGMGGPFKGVVGVHQHAQVGRAY
jgi:hypothetical protein